MDIIERRIGEREGIIKKAREYSNTINFRATVLLIGSYARGDFNLWSDVDVLIIGNFNGNSLQRLKAIDFPPGFEVILLTPQEFIKMKSKNIKLVKDAYNEGVILRDDFQIMDQLSKQDKVTDNRASF